MLVEPVEGAPVEISVSLPATVANVERALGDKLGTDVHLYNLGQRMNAGDFINRERLPRVQLVPRVVPHGLLNRVGEGEWPREGR